MGIRNLLKFVDSAIVNGNHQDLVGLKLGIDTSCFIHKAVNYDDYIRYITLLKDLFAKCECQEFWVLDGKRPEAKKETCERRALEQEKRGSLKIDEEVMARVRDCLADRTVIQAPGEADAQLAYMANNGIIDAVVTEDSDLIVYGCSKIFFKLKPFGDCTVYERKRLDLKGLDFHVFRWACILAGCDYFPGGFKGLGLAKATVLLQKVKPEPPYNFAELRRVLNTLKGVDANFVRSFLLAEHTFLHQRVADLVSGEIKPLNNYTEYDEIFSVPIELVEPLESEMFIAMQDLSQCEMEIKV